VPGEIESVVERVGVLGLLNTIGKANRIAPLRMTGGKKGNLLPEKLRGRFRVPGLLLADTSLSASFSSLPFSWLPWFYSPFSIFHGLAIATVNCCN
jgi:hypothetical protein